MNNYIEFLIGVLIISSITACTEKMVVKVKNNSVELKKHEIVEVPFSKELIGSKYVSVVNALNQESLTCQLSDKNDDGLADAVLFQPEIGANESATFIIKKVDSLPNVESKVYSRFVPERTDDYAWENDRVAFRTYGPVAQELKKKGDPTGTLSSGFDCWLKKVDYPIINKWYKKHTSGEGSYHIDTGEGYDPYHVGGSRGCGGIGVFRDSVLYVSENFIAYKTLENGPVRTRFVLDYDDWQAGGNLVKEQKEIRLDLGNNLMHVLEHVQGFDTLTIGIT